MTATFPAKLLIEKSSQSLLVDSALWTYKTMERQGNKLRHTCRGLNSERKSKIKLAARFSPPPRGNFGATSASNFFWSTAVQNTCTLYTSIGTNRQAQNFTEKKDVTHGTQDDQTRGIL